MPSLPGQWRQASDLNHAMNTATRKRTPRDATEFEREQLRYLLTTDDLSATLAEVNPSLAWLPILVEMKLIQPGTQLAPWVERNFGETDAIRDVAANIHFFVPETAGLLEFRLNREADRLSPLLVKCWRLIIRSMRTGNRTALRNDWFDIAPRIKRGERTPELIERLADVLTPKLRIGKRLAWRDEDNRGPPQRPTDLMSIDYETDEAVSEDDVLSEWPLDAPAEADEKLLHVLTTALSVTLEDAIDVGVESNTAYSISDTDVPSVAHHQQNAYRTGFLPIVRVIADVWARLAIKDRALALPFVDSWRTSPYRLVRRLALYAAADTAVPPEMAAQVLKSLPLGELFLTNSTVEVYRLMRARWHDFPAEAVEAIQNRIIEGPPHDWFRAGTEVETHIDRARYDLLGDLERSGIELNAAARTTLADIKRRWPQWQLRPPEQAGFNIWHEGSSAIIGDAGKLQNVPDDALIPAAKAAAETADFMEGDAWQALCQNEPGRALRGLETEAKRGNWPAWAWNPFLWAAQKLERPEDVARAGELLLKCPSSELAQMAEGVSFWLDEKAKVLRDELLWPLWDRIEESIPRNEVVGRMHDALTDSLNSPAGRLSEVLLKKLTKGPGGEEMPEAMRERFDKLLAAGDSVGFLARIRVAGEVSFLFERAPSWTAERVVPLFQWSSPDAQAAWSARKYANYIGSPALFEQTKGPFLELFSRSDVPDEDRRIYAEWLAAIIIANQRGQAGYPITKPEARSALRRVGPAGLGSVGHRLALEMEEAKPEQKKAVWRDVVGPVFNGIWPLDAELQSPTNTFKLVQILRATGDAFTEAAVIIIPFIRAEDPLRHSSVFSISEADEVIYSSSPEKMLDLLAAVVGDAPVKSVFELNKALERVRALAPSLANTKKFQKLMAQASVP
jgi:hypothetical protein